MSDERFLLLHGPLESVGINHVSARLNPDTSARDHAYARFHCGENIRVLSQAFRAHGFKVCYSGWNEDREWLESNRELFDALILSDQTHLKSQNVREGRVIPNNKEKFFYSAFQGVSEIERVSGSVSGDASGGNPSVFRLRSDIVVRPDLARQETMQVAAQPDVLKIEYLNGQKVWAFPDFMMAARASVMKELYGGMFERAVSGQGYHISSHVEHSISAIGMKLAGRIGAIHCMSKAIWESVVWRGIPRYMEHIFDEHGQHLSFDVAVNIPPDMDLQRVIAGVSDTFSGKSRD